MSRFRLTALPLVGLGLLTSASGGRVQQQAIARAAVAPIDAVLERDAARLCADFVASVAEKLVRTSASGESCEAAAASVLQATASSEVRTMKVVEYAKPKVERLEVSGPRATVTLSGFYVLSTGGREIGEVRIIAFGPLRIQLEEAVGVWRVSSAATMAAVCLQADCQPGSSQLAFSYGEPRPAPLKFVLVPVAVRRAGGAEEREFKEGRRVTAQAGCLACHRIGDAGNPRPGVNLTHIGAELSEAELASALVDSRQPMPSFRNLPAAKLHAVVKFLSLLR
jgi:mono/diheme cytochrome c family protein